MSSVFKNRWTGGEIDRWALGAINSEQYAQSCARLENFNILDLGGLSRRKGFRRIQKILEGENPSSVRLIPFYASANTAYLFYLSKGKIGYVKIVNGEPVGVVERLPPGM